MGPIEGIKKVGFRRWYERQLIESHAWFVTCFMCMIMLASSMDSFDFHEPGLRPVLLFLIFLGGIAGCLFAFIRYSRLLNRAESWGAQSTCASCGAYGVLQVVGSVQIPRDTSACLDVRCRRCGHGWRMQGDR